MSSEGLVEQLVGMGFEEGRANIAVQRIPTKTLDAAIDWLSANEGKTTEELAAATESSVELVEGGAEGAPAASASQEARSLVCKDCGKQLRDVREAEFHASKSGHANFEESAEEKKPLTAEEKKEQTAKLQKLIAEKKAGRLEEERLEALEKEKKRRMDGQSVKELKEQMQEKELREAYAERKRQKELDKAAKQRVLDQIAQDKANRAAAAKGEAAPVAKAQPSVVAAPPKADYSSSRIQVRLLDGSALTQTFQASEQLAAVRLFAQLNRKDGSDEPFRLMTTFPRKLFTDEDMDKPLKELGLVPNAVLVATKATV